MMDKPHYNIVIATPGTHLVAGYVQSLLATGNALAEQGLSSTWLNAGGSHVAVARERTVCGDQYNDNRINALMGGTFTYDKLFWIDSDIIWRVQDFSRLANSDLDIVSGCYMMADQVVVMSKKPWGGLMPLAEFVQYKEPFAVSSVGFGFICMKSGVMESLGKPWFGSIPENDRFLIGEDVSWCIKARRQGYDIWVDPSVRVDHQKSVIVSWDGLEAFVQSRPPLEGALPTVEGSDLLGLTAGDPDAVLDDAHSL